MAQQLSNLDCSGTNQALLPLATSTDCHKAEATADGDCVSNETFGCGGTKQRNLIARLAESDTNSLSSSTCFFGLNHVGSIPLPSRPKQILNPKQQSTSPAEVDLQSGVNSEEGAESLAWKPGSPTSVSNMPVEVADLTTRTAQELSYGVKSDLRLVEKVKLVAPVSPRPVKRPKLTIHTNGIRSKFGATDRTVSDGSPVEEHTAGDSKLNSARIGIYWPEDATYYKAKIIAFDAAKEKYRVKYDDGAEEWLTLHREKLKWLCPRGQSAGCDMLLKEEFVKLKAVNVPTAALPQPKPKENRGPKEVPEGQSSVGRRCAVQCPVDGEYYRGEILSFDKSRGLYHILYDDGEDEWLDLGRETVNWTRQARPNTHASVGLRKGRATPKAKKAIGWLIGVYRLKEMSFREGRITGYDKSTSKHLVKFTGCDKVAHLALSGEKVKWIFPPNLEANDTNAAEQSSKDDTQLEPLASAIEDSVSEATRDADASKGTHAISKDTSSMAVEGTCSKNVQMCESMHMDEAAVNETDAKSVVAPAVRAHETSSTISVDTPMDQAETQQPAKAIKVVPEPRREQQHTTTATSRQLGEVKPSLEEPAACCSQPQAVKEEKPVEDKLREVKVEVQCSNQQPPKQKTKPVRIAIKQESLKPKKQKVSPRRNEFVAVRRMSALHPVWGEGRVGCTELPMMVKIMCSGQRHASHPTIKSPPQPSIQFASQSSEYEQELVLLDMMLHRVSEAELCLGGTQTAASPPQHLDDRPLPETSPAMPVPSSAQLHGQVPLESRPQVELVRTQPVGSIAEGLLPMPTVGLAGAVAHGQLGPQGVGLGQASCTAQATEQLNSSADQADPLSSLGMDINMIGVEDIEHLLSCINPADGSLQGL